MIQYLYTSFCITALIESYWIQYMLTWHHSGDCHLMRTRINVVKGRIAWYVASLHHIQSRTVPRRISKKGGFCFIFRSKLFSGCCDALAMISVRRHTSLCYGHQASARDLAKTDVQDTNCFSHLNASLRNGQLYFILLDLKISALDCSCRKPAIFAAYCPQ